MQAFRPTATQTIHSGTTLYVTLPLRSLEYRLFPLCRTQRSMLSLKRSRTIPLKCGNFTIGAVESKSPALEGTFDRDHKTPRYLLAKPNDAHRALATLAHPPTLARIAPQHTRPRVLHITQNVDALALRVLESLPTTEGDNDPAKDALIEMHGNIFLTRCTSCNHIQRSYAPTLAAALAELERRPAADGDQGGAKPVVTLEQLPKCGGDAWAGSNRYGRCGGLLRPEVVWFGEVPPMMGEISRQLSACDFLLVVGTSSTVSRILVSDLWRSLILGMHGIAGSSGRWVRGTGEKKWGHSCGVQRWAILRR